MIRAPTERPTAATSSIDLAVLTAPAKGESAGDSFNRQLEAALGIAPDGEPSAPDASLVAGSGAVASPVIPAGFSGQELPDAGMDLPSGMGSVSAPTSGAALVTSAQPTLAPTSLAPDVTPATTAQPVVPQDNDATSPAPTQSPVRQPVTPGTGVLISLPVALDAPATPQLPLIARDLKPAPAPKVSKDAPSSVDASQDSELPPAPPRPHARSEAAAPLASAPLPSQDAAPTALQSSPQAPTPAPATAAAPPPASTPATAAPETRADPRVGTQIEAAIEQLADTRQAARSARPEILMRHADFGLVSLRLDASSGDLRATLAARDPGFVPSVQAALAERAVAASSETSTGQRGSDSQSQSGSHASGQTGGSGHSFANNYGSSPGSSQGSPQPRLHHHQPAQSERGDSASEDSRSRASRRDGTDGVFA